MRLHRKAIRLTTSALLVAGFALAGCQTSSHKSVRTYEYADEPTQKRSESEKLDSEYKNGIARPDGISGWHGRGVKYAPSLCEGGVHALPGLRAVPAARIRSLR